MSAEVETQGVLLTMDTTGDVCGVAVLRDGVFVAEHTFRHGMHLSERLMGHLDAVLRDADATLSDVHTFAVGIGPGSFTGTRIGVMTVKTLADVLQKPVVGIGSLDALAAEYAGLKGAVVVPLLPCRAGSVYACPFLVDTSTPRPLAEPAALSLVELATQLQAFQPSSVLICGAAAEKSALELAALLQESAIPLSCGQALFPRASLVARLAWERLQTQPEGEDVLALVPLYISPPPITLPKQEIPLPKSN